MSATTEVLGSRAERDEARRSRFAFLGTFAFSREDSAWFSAVFVAALAGGWWLVYIAEIWVGDALSRVNQAYSIVLGRDPHLGAIGFIWPPLPSMLEIPLVLMIGQFAAPVFAGQIVSALFSAMLAVTLNRTLEQTRVPRQWRIPLVLFTMLNPLVVYSAINGMTENIFLFFAVAATRELLRWRPGEQRGLVVAALYIGIGFFVRYEAVAFAGVGAIALIIRVWSRPLQQDHLEAILTSFVAPISYCIGLWVMWNTLFAGDPLFFLTGAGSNTFYTAPIRAGADPILSPLYGNLVASVLWSVRRVVGLFPFFIPLLVLVAIRTVWKRDRVAALLVGMAAIGPLFEWSQIYRGQLLVMYRFWIYPVGFMPILIAMLARDYLAGTRARIYALGTAALLVACVSTLFTMSGESGGADERQFASAIASGDPANLTRQLGTDYDAQRATAAIINDLHNARPDSSVLIDGLLDWSVQLFVSDQSRLITDRDRDHGEILRDPVDRVNYILIRDPGRSLPSLLLTRFPTLYRDGAPWASFVTDIPDARLRLFRVISTAEQGQGVRPISPPRS
ncbi:MAG: hypothetical protein C4558_08225 [Dehalococcoidia bacterium]|nr:MAG: hypothetical protein C4558_08225 [Dehalococcoidia bacterium]